MKYRIAVLDDYQQVAFRFADWARVTDHAEVVIFHEHLNGPENVIAHLQGCAVLCVMRERTPLTKDILQNLPALKLIVSTGMRNASIDLEACAALNIDVKYTGYHETGAPELTWALLLNLAKNIQAESQHIKNNEWQQTISTDIAGKTLGIIGLGRVGSTIARYAKAFGMKVIAWSENLTEEKAHRAGAELVSKAQLFQQADFVTLHLVLSGRSKHTITQTELSLMKPTAYLINTSRGPLIKEEDLVKALQNQQIAGAALDVYDTEPLPADHPFRQLPNVLATPHIGYVTGDTYQVFYRDTVTVLEEWLDSQSQQE